MIAIAILLIVLMISMVFGLWAIDLRLDRMRADLDRIENRINAIAGALGVEDELEDTWPTMPDLDGGIDRFAHYPVTGEPEP